MFGMQVVCSWRRESSQALKNLVITLNFMVLCFGLGHGCFYSPDIIEEPDEEKYAPIIQRDNVSPSLVGRVLISSEQHFDFEVNIVEDRNIEDKLSARWIHGDTALFSPDHIQNTGTVNRAGVTLEVDFCSYPYNGERFMTLTFAVTDGEWLDRAGGGPSYTPEDLLRVTEGSHVDFVQWALELGEQCN